MVLMNLLVLGWLEGNWGCYALICHVNLGWSYKRDMGSQFHVYLALCILSLVDFICSELFSFLRFYVMQRDEGLLIFWMREYFWFESDGETNIRVLCLLKLINQLIFIKTSTSYKAILNLIGDNNWNTPSLFVTMFDLFSFTTYGLMILITCYTLFKYNFIIIRKSFIL